MSIIAAFLLAAATPAPASAPIDVPTDAALRSAIVARDNEFFALFFNGCDPDRLAKMLAPDFEFYHDREGVVTRAAAPFVVQYRERCEAGKAPDAWHSRRELVASSLKVFPIKGYGAIEQGEHLFYERRGEGSEHLAGRAAFSQLWALDGGVWKLARVFSFDHSAAK
jgi:hypothetical protein